MTSKKNAKCRLKTVSNKFLLNIIKRRDIVGMVQRLPMMYKCTNCMLSSNKVKTEDILSIYIPRSKGFIK